MQWIAGAFIALRAVPDRNGVGRRAGVRSARHRVFHRNPFDVSPNLNFPISSTVAGFVEAAASYSGHRRDQALAGGGFSMMLTSAVQLDLSADFGLTSRSPDMLAGFGISVFE